MGLENEQEGKTLFFLSTLHPLFPSPTLDALLLFFSSVPSGCTAASARIFHAVFFFHAHFRNEYPEKTPFYYRLLAINFGKLSPTLWLFPRPFVRVLINAS